MKVSNRHQSTTLVPSDFFKGLPFWNELSQSEQKTVQNETVAFAGAVHRMRQSRLEAAYHLQKVKNVLLAKGHFNKYVQSLAQSGRSSYRWLNRVTELSLPAAVIEAAIDKGVDLVQSSYVQAIKQLPPPKALADATASDPKVAHYLERVEAARADVAPAVSQLTPSESERTAWRAVMREFKRVPSRSRGAWGLRLLARLMGGMSIPTQRIEQEAVPGDFKPKAGYPKGRPRN